MTENCRNRPALHALIVLAVVLTVPAAMAQPTADDRVKADELLLREHGIGADAPALLDFFRKRTPGPADLKQIEQLVAELGVRNFARRQKASADLVKWGPAALPALRASLKDPDIERVRRAETCIAEIQRTMDTAVPSAAARLLAARKSPESTAVLLAFLPQADDESVEDEVLAVLAALHKLDVQPHTALIKATTDDKPLRRAAAGFALGRQPHDDARKAAEKLLTDRDPIVRFRAAEGLLAGRQKSAVPALCDLLRDAPPATVYRAEELLYRLPACKAGEPLALPEASAGEGSAGARQKYRDAWVAWWSKHEKELDLARLSERPEFLNLTLVPEMHANKVWEYGPDGKVRWELTTNLQSPIDAEVLPGGRLLVAEIAGGRVTERDRTGKIVWQHAVQTPIACHRLPNGNTFISTNNAAFIVTPDGKEVFRYTAENNFFIHSIQYQPNGHLYAISMNGVVREIDRAGKAVTNITLPERGGWSGIEGLPGRRFLVVGAGRVRELDAAGKVLWETNQPGACYATRLPNGNTLIADNSKGIVEVDRAGKRVAERPVTTGLWRVHRR